MLNIIRGWTETICMDLLSVIPSWSVLSFSKHLCASFVRSFVRWQFACGFRFAYYFWCALTSSPRRANDQMSSIGFWLFALCHSPGENLICIEKHNRNQRNTCNDKDHTDACNGTSCWVFSYQFCIQCKQLITRCISNVSIIHSQKWKKNSGKICMWNCMSSINITIRTDLFIRFAVRLQLKYLATVPFLFQIYCHKKL